MKDLISERMDSPERLLPTLNHALRALRGAMDVLEDGGLDEKLLVLMRRFLLAEVLGGHTVVAIAGAQGAGKSTLLRGMYDLEGDAGEWLPANEGRGEKLPVLVLEEAGITVPNGVLRQLQRDEMTGEYRVRDVPADQQTFRAACCGDNSAVLLPVLRVPPRYFNRSGAAWLLLPGYETVDRGNRDWQELMRQGFIGSAFFVVVTDATRMASAGQAQIIMDWKAGLLKDVRPVVVISKTDGKADRADELQTLRQSAADLFGLDAAAAERGIVCTGTASNSAYKQVWLPVLTAMLQDMTAGGSGHRDSQMRQLEQVLRSDLRDLLSTIKSRARDYLEAGEAADGGGQAVVRDCLEAFDEAQASLAEAFDSAVQKVLSAHAAAAWDDLQDKLVDRHEGLGNKFKNMLNTVTEDQRKLEASVEEAWAKPGSVLEQFADGLLGITSPVLRDAPLEALPPAEGTSAQDAAPVAVWQRLRYVDQHGLPVQWIDPNEARLRDLRRIFSDDHSPTSPQLQEAIKLLPAMTLEYVRSATLLLSAAKLLPDTLSQVPVADVAASLERMQVGMKEGGDQIRAVVAGVTALFAGDVAEDGQLNLFGLMSAATPSAGAAVSAGASTAGAGAAGAGAAGAGAGAAGTGIAAAGAATAASVAAAAVALVAVGYLVHLGVREARQYDNVVRSHAHGMLLSIRDSHRAHFSEQFNVLMGRVREYLKLRLRRRYGLNERLMLQDRLAKALADVGSARRALLEELAPQGHGLESIRVAVE